MPFQYDPPGFMADFTANQRAQWSEYISTCFQQAIAYEETKQLNSGGERCQLYDQAGEQPAEPHFEQPITWNALPGTLVARFGRQQALRLADYLYPWTWRMDLPGEGYTKTLPLAANYYRPQDEYCEWHVSRRGDGKIINVTFVSEPPEYWQALFGGPLLDLNQNSFEFDGDPNLVLDLYRELLGTDEVKLDDLVCQYNYVDDRNTVIYPKGGYNPYNVWNTQRGAIHLTHPANSITAEIQLAADATILRTRDGRLVTDPSDLIICSAYGGPNRTSDPTIGASVNELAALGMRLTLRNPVGLYMHHIDLTPFRTPDNEMITADYFTVLRGDADHNLIERAVFTVPPGHDFTVSDLTVAGLPLQFGSQIAEHITVQLVAIADSPGHFSNTPVGPVAAGAIQLQPATDLGYIPLQGTPAPPQRAVFVQPPIRITGALPMHVARARRAVTVTSPQSRRHGTRYA